MKLKTLLLFLFLASFVSGDAAISESRKLIVIKKSAKVDSVLRSVDVLASAYYDLNNELLFVNLENYSKDVTITVTNRSKDEILYSGLLNASSDIVLNMNGLLEEGSDYRLEIIIGETILYGEFNL